MASTVEQFKKLFTGSDSAYGEWDNNRDPKALTRHAIPSTEIYQGHLDGKLGLGIVPVNSAGISFFAAIDIDVDTIDHGILYKDIVQRGIPLHVCRSKSGGAHCYLFMREPGISAAKIQKVLSQWAAILGYPTAEIFPKQTKTSPGNYGNWINLPYFGGDNTTRYAVGPDGALSLDEFLGSIQYYTGLEIISPTHGGVDMPPCLKTLTEQGVQSGSRNQGLFNFAVFYRKSDPENWQERVRTQNTQFFSPPLDLREVGGIFNSVGRAKYQYMCNQSPIREVCNKPECLKTPFGVGHMPWDEKGSFDDLLVENCRKLTTDPPRYTVSVNNVDITLIWEELFLYQRFRSKIGQELNIVASPMKQPAWEQTVRGLLAERVDVEAPDDASMIGMVIDKLHEFLVLRERATEREDLLRGLPVLEGTSVLFRAVDFKRYLQGFKMDKIDMSELFLILKKQGNVHKRIRLSGRQTTVWAYPVDQIHEQTEDFTAANFAKDLEEL